MASIAQVSQLLSVVRGTVGRAAWVSGTVLTGSNSSLVVCYQNSEVLSRGSWECGGLSNSSPVTWLPYKTYCEGRPPLAGLRLNPYTPT
ncbi:hypothetical protein E2C01_008754 [Portunus trituberculatus]|uniref:Uncharacterized protein n=1 Tax=Portunus trituberculatus TaxID=210409 RepID=A0A5B7D2T1_PORTR|nr:hypothetical protein [Portunus trituberculatus]